MQEITDEDVANSGYNVMYKGPGGSGKTYAACSWPGKTALCAFDANTTTWRNAKANGADIIVYKFDGWRDFSDSFLPLVANRELEVDNIVIDTWDMLANSLWKEVQGTRSRLTQQDFGTGLNKMMDVMGMLAEGSTYINNTAYNIIVNVHLVDVSDDGGSIVKTSPMIMGRFKDMIEDYFDYVLLCEGKTKAKVESGKSVLSKEYIVYSVPPTQLHTCKGPGLPPVCGGTYNELMKHLKKPASKQQTDNNNSVD